MPLILDSSSESLSDIEHDPREERRRLHHDADVVIIGAGVLGSALAVALGDAGRSVILLEKSLKEPDRIVGELLQPGGVAALKTLGLGHCLENIDAVNVKGYGVFYHGEPVNIPYPPDHRENSDTPAEGRSFHHGRFVSKLRAAALSHPNVTVFETEVTSLVSSNSEVTSQVIGVETLTRKTQQDFFFGSLTIVADGYNSKFRKVHQPERVPVSKSKFWALELKHETCPLPMPNHGHVILSPDTAPILLYQIGSHETRALIDIPENTPTASLAQGGVKNHLLKMALPNIPEAVQSCFKEAIETGSLRSMPNSFLPPTINKTPGLAFFGDALNMRHPLTGGGMTVALNDVVLLKSLLSASAVDIDDNTVVLQQMKTFHWQRKNLTSVINVLAQALYSLFAANDVQLRYLQKGCFRYFQNGGDCVAVPAGLLAGIIPQPLVLVYHFFAVALLSIWVMMIENGMLGLLLGQSFVQGVLILYKACVVFLPYVWAETKG